MCLRLSQQKELFLVAGFALEGFQNDGEEFNQFEDKEFVDIFSHTLVRLLHFHAHPDRDCTRGLRIPALQLSSFRGTRSPRVSRTPRVEKVKQKQGSHGL